MKVQLNNLAWTEGQTSVILDSDDIAEMELYDSGNYKKVTVLYKSGTSRLFWGRDAEKIWRWHCEEVEKVLI